ncbi:class I adenylate-forming enzyme family protein [Arthrobacter sp. Soil763]|uniref:class I adenylate-forming enzyme family protein n=1 Tax=Arthrobacter sp. Soil763 TaxID=1736402 RepID=UPI0006FC7718|nr:AMP-binding protein [Arthrobacter sp. Soil763]KRE81690.1 long-chain fatty acid--CoA ligase [Arthrobacter sp. Soil763]
MSAIGFFDRGWNCHPDGVAYVQENTTYTFTEAGELSCRIANALLDAGLSPEAKVAVLSPNDPLAWICVLGIWRSGLTWIPANPASPAGETAQLLAGFDAELVIFHAGLDDAVLKLQDRLPAVRQWVRFGEGPGADAGAAPVSGAVPFSEWVAAQPATKPAVENFPDDVVSLAPTGGTTGLPKGVMNTNRSLSAFVTHLMMAAHYGSEDAVVNLAAAPMTHTAGLLSLAATARGGTVVVLPRAHPHAVLDAIEKYAVTDLFLPPTVIYRLLEVLKEQPRDLSSLHYLIYGAAPMSVEKLRQALTAIGPVMMELYGQMEAPASVTFLRPDEHFVAGEIAPDSRLSSCGRPYPLVQVEIRDDDGRALPAGTPGEICVRGDLVMKGYYKNPAQTAQALQDGWLHTGDIGFFDQEGYLHLTDRRRDLIISGGFNVYPSEVEQVIWGHPAVRDCAVVGSPHPDWGEAVTAVVELNEGCAVTEAEIIALCKQELGSVRAPKTVQLVPALPRSVNGKVLKKNIRETFWRNETSRI